MGTTLTLEFLKHIKQFEERIMHHHLSELKHPQWGSVVGYEADVRLAVLEDELEVWEKRAGDDPDHIPYLGYIRTTLKDRIEEVRKDAVLFKDPPDGDLKAILEEKNESVYNDAQINKKHQKKKEK